MAGDEDQLTEMLAFLWQQEPAILGSWLASLRLAAAASATDVETQFTLPNGRRPDIYISWNGGCALVESKLKSGFGGTQIGDYLEYLAGLDGQRVLILLTERPEHVPPEYKTRAREARVALVTQRWHDMARHVAEPGEESLAGDFLQLLIREGLVKPFDGRDWTTWNGGYNVLLRLDAFLDELGPLVRRMKPEANFRATTGHSKRWIYRTW